MAMIAQQIAEKIVLTEREFSIGPFKVQAKTNLDSSKGFFGVITEVYAKAKGVADLFGILSKGADLAGRVVSESVRPWTSKVKTTFGDARSALSLPYFPSTVKKAMDTGDFRDALEVGKIGSYSVSLFIPNIDVAKALGTIGGLFTTTLDGIDLVREGSNYRTISNLSDIAQKSTGLSAKDKKEICAGIDDHVQITLLRVLKLALGFFTGLCTTVAFVAGVTLPLPVAIAALAAGLFSIIFSFAADYSSHVAKMPVKIQNLSAAPAA